MKALKQSALVVAFLGILFLGCDDEFLTQTNPNMPTTDTFWETAEQAQKATTAVYQVLTYDGLYMRMGHALPDFRGDDVKGDSPWGSLQKIGIFTLESVRSSVRYMWRDIYHGVYRANQVLFYVPDIEMDGALKTRLLGETRFLRGFFYFYLVKMYNNIPLILEPITNPDEYLQPQAPPEDVWNQVIADFSEAQAVLPTVYPSSDVGRLTWGAATAYLGVAYLFNQRWSEADAEFKKIIDSGLYALVADPRDNGGLQNENNEESIFEIQYSRDIGGTRNGWAGAPRSDWGLTNARSITYAPVGYGWADTVPTRGLFEAFKSEQTVDGEDDPRLHATMFYNAPGMTVYGDSFAEVYAADLTQIFWRKYQSDIPGGNEKDMRSGINFRAMRYADVLLMYAETQNELGNQATAAQYVQMVRDRARLPNRQAEFSALSQQEMRDRIAHERYLELAVEGKRFDDIRRWGWLDNPAKLAELKARDPEFEGYFPGREWLPIPQSEIDTNPLLQQNTTY